MWSQIVQECPSITWHLAASPKQVCLFFLLPAGRIGSLGMLGVGRAELTCDFGQMAL